MKKIFKKLLQRLRQKKPTFIQKVDRWQTEMYNYKVEQESQAHR